MSITLTDYTLYEWLAVYSPHMAMLRGGIWQRVVQWLRVVMDVSSMDRSDSGHTYRIESVKSKK